MKQRLALHGRDHRVGGSDPIPDIDDSIVRFDKDPQEGTFLTAWASGPVGGINLFATWVARLRGGSNIDGSAFATSIEAGPTDAGVTALGGKSYINANTGGTSAQVETTSAGYVNVYTGGVLKLQLRPDGTIHGPTGGSIVFDL